VRIADADGNPLTKVYLALTRPEAKELRDALDDLETTTESGWHVHVHDAEYEREVTVYRADDQEAVF
jgi:hypothetical protein